MKIKKIFISCLFSLLVTVSAHAASETSCLNEMGKKQAQTLVEQCLQVSPATHPPCNSSNSCELIKSEIQRGCAFLGNNVKKPSFCSSQGSKS